MFCPVFKLSRVRWISPLLVLWLLSAAVQAHQAKPVLRIATFDSPLPIVSVSEAVVRALYAHTGIELELVRLPGHKALDEADMGNLDGDLVRYSGVSANATQLVRLPHPIGYADIMAYGRDASPLANGWDSLEGKKVGFIQGFSIAEIHVKPPYGVPLSNHKALFRALAREELDIVVLTRLDKLALRDLDMPTSARIWLKEPPLQQIALYHYVHARHEDIINRLRQTMHHMASSGELLKTFRAARASVYRDFRYSSR